MPGRTRGETCALRDASREFSHRHGFLSVADHAALTFRQSIDEAVRMHSAPKDSPPTVEWPGLHGLPLEANHADGRIAVMRRAERWFHRVFFPAYLYPSCSNFALRM